MITAKTRFVHWHFIVAISSNFIIRIINIKSTNTATIQFSCWFFHSNTMLTIWSIHHKNAFRRPQMSFTASTFKTTWMIRISMRKITPFTTFLMTHLTSGKETWLKFRWSNVIFCWNNQLILNPWIIGKCKVLILFNTI